MFTVTGACNCAVCYCQTLEESAVRQIRAVCDEPAFQGSKIRIMPDVHAGMGCTIGTTMTLTDRVVPGMVGVDIGCGMETVRLAEHEADFTRLDALIRTKIPSGRAVRNAPHPFAAQIDLTALRCAAHVNLGRARRSIGTLGGGNHFIELDRGEGGELYLVIHSGSRHLGNEVALYYQDAGYRALSGDYRAEIQRMIASLRAEGREQELEPQLQKLKKERLLPGTLPKSLACVEGALFDDYLADMKLVQQFASFNRKAMADEILRGLALTPVDSFSTIHNYIDTGSMILRKGAVSAKNGERLLIPINMRDGSLICVGRGNPDWNCSAPHGAGRLMSRREAFSTLSMEQYQREMADVFTSCVLPDTLDESPMAYKPMDEIVAQIGPTADIIAQIRPVYNFKASE